MSKLNLSKVHPTWASIVKHATEAMDSHYLYNLEQDQTWLPGADNVFNAFSLPLTDVRYILFGESPYPRAQSAIGYAFWDGAVHDLWSEQGLSKPVNRATSLRNIIKMLLVARGNLRAEDTSQPAIAKLDKSALVTSIDELFENFLKQGIMLLNASLVLSNNSVRKDANYWRVFMTSLLDQLCNTHPEIQLILFGKVAKAIESISSSECFQQFHAEHPYNISFITNPEVLNFFRPMDLLAKKKS